MRCLSGWSEVSGSATLPPDPPAEAGGILTIDLDALAANWRLLNREAAGAECSAVLKADAYGTGMDRVAPALWEAGCRTFFVAQLAEGRSLRALLPDATIYVLNGLLPGTEAFYERHALRPVLGALPEIEAWTGFAVGRSVPLAALHVDTGLNRLGLEVPEALALGEAGVPFPLALVMSHFAASEEPGHPLTARQIERFAAVRSAFPGVPASLANSSGIFLGPRARHDLVRPGYTLYGGNPTPHAPNPMRGVVRLDARIVQLGMADEGEGVGYGAHWTAHGRRKLAMVSIGYADGFPRGGGSEDGRPGGSALVHGQRCPIAGHISMDLTTIDVTEVAAPLARGDRVTLLGDELTLEAVADAAGTNGYQVLTALGRRHHRIYLGG
jgi:alanine racemase